ncbi:hypothetical protein WOLCODRAFT_60125, partial [Wolfiporia cocos MD-104 SS10]
DWFVDLSIEVSEGGQVLQWIRYIHECLLRFALPQVPERHLRQHMRGKYFWCDQVSQLTESAGFQSEPLQLEREDGIVYINCYTMDKLMTYQMHLGVFRRHGPSDLFPEKTAVLLSNMKKMSQMFMACQGDPCRNMEPQEGTAQFKLRVLLDIADAMLLHFPHELIDLAIFNFKFLRLLGLLYLVHNISSVPCAHRMWTPNLRLGAIATYMLNVLIYQAGEREEELTLVKSSA